MKQAAYFVFLLIFATSCEPVGLFLSFEGGQVTLKGSNIPKPTQHSLSGQILVLDKGEGKLSPIPLKGTLDLEALRKEGLLKPISGKEIPISKMEAMGHFKYTDRVLIVSDGVEPFFLAPPCDDEEILEVTSEGLVFRDATGGGAIAFPTIPFDGTSVICFQRIAGVGIICIEDNIDERFFRHLLETLELFFGPSLDWPDQIGAETFDAYPYREAVSKNGGGLNCQECILEGDEGAGIEWEQIPCNFAQGEVTIKKVCQSYLQFYKNDNRNPCLTIDLTSCPAKVVLEDEQVLVYTLGSCEPAPQCGC